MGRTAVWLLVFALEVVLLTQLPKRWYGGGIHPLRQWAAGTFVVLALFYSGWTIFGGDANVNDEQGVAVLALETRDKGYVIRGIADRGTAANRSRQAGRSCEPRTARGRTSAAR